MILLNYRNLILIILLIAGISSANELHGQHFAYSGETKEIIQTENYTYILVKEESNEKWLAVPKVEIETGEEIFYNQGMLMPNFESKELERTFPAVYFMAGVKRRLVLLYEVKAFEY